MNSMTGFGRAEEEFGAQRLNIEVKSVNHRFLDISIRMPKFMLFLENDARKLIKDRLTRGRIDVFITYTDLGGAQKTVLPDIALIKAYLSAIEDISEQTGVLNDINMSSLVRLPEALTFIDEKHDENELKDELMKCLNAALDELVSARAAEGERICTDIFERIEALSALIDGIEQREPLVVDEYRARLHKRLSELLTETELDENRFNTEIVYFADKCSITEEIVRVRSHLAQCRETLLGDAAAGRNTDFIIQELNREFNTIGSKSQDVAITKLVLEAKTEVEKIREQIQNIE